MRICFSFSLLVLLLFSGICFAQAPKPALSGGLASGDISVSVLLPVKDQSLSHIGVGGDLSSTLFFGAHCGAQLEGSYERSDFADFRDGGVRVGPMIRLSTKRAIQPYVHALFGYSRVKDSLLNPTTSYHSSGSFLVGGGLEFPLLGAWYGRVGADFQDDWTVRQQSGRGTVGVLYRFGAQSQMER